MVFQCYVLWALFSWQVSGCLLLKSLNIGCYIKEVTNQADGERCHRVSILQGRCTSLRKAHSISSDLKYPTCARSTCTRTSAGKNTATHKCMHIYATTHEYIHSFTNTYIHKCAAGMLTQRAHLINAKDAIGLCWWELIKEVKNGNSSWCIWVNFTSAAAAWSGLFLAEVVAVINGW